MNSPGVDHEVVTSMAAVGANIDVFTTGRGTPTGFPFVPVIKVTGNRIFNWMTETMDIDAGSIIASRMTVREAIQSLTQSGIVEAQQGSMGGLYPEGESQ